MPGENGALICTLHTRFWPDCWSDALWTASGAGAVPEARANGTAIAAVTSPTINTLTPSRKLLSVRRTSPAPADP
jgi:hypothetical protein